MVGGGRSQGGYAFLRGALAERYAGASDAVVERIARRALAGVHPQDVEDWLSSLAQIAPVVLPALAGAVGTVVGGPVGTAVGGALGTAGASAIGAAAAQRSKPRRKPARPAPPRKPPPHAPRQTAVARPRPGALPGATQGPVLAGNPQAATLFATLARPEVLQALAAMAFGAAGASHIEIAGQLVPIEAIVGLLGMLADQAAVQHGATEPIPPGALDRVPGVPEYLLDGEGRARCEVTSAEQRGEVLLQLLAEAAANDSTREAAAEAGVWAPPDFHEALEMYGAMPLGLWREGEP